MCCRKAFSLVFKTLASHHQISLQIHNSCLEQKGFVSLSHTYLNSKQNGNGISKKKKFHLFGASHGSF